MQGGDTVRLCKLCKGIVACILTLATAFYSLCVPVFAQSSDISLSFSLTEVEGDVTTVELGLRVKTDGTEKFKAAATVLEIDNSVLSLIPWDTYVAYATEAATDWESALPIGTKGIDEYMSSSAQAYNVGSKTYLYLSAEAIQPEKIGDDKQVVTVRFTYKDTKSGDDIIIGDTIKLAEDNTVVFNSPVQNSVTYSNDEVFYFYNPLKLDESNSVIENADIDSSLILEPPTFGELKKGESIAGTTTKPENGGALSVSFYDWDETLLGVLAVSPGEDISEKVNDYAKGFIHPDLRANYTSVTRSDTYRGKYPSVYGDPSTVDLNGNGYPLTNKLDYVFYKGDTSAEDYDGYYFAHGWIPVTAQTLNGRAADGVFTAYTSTDAAEAANPIDFSQGITESVMVKAAYVPGELLKNGSLKVSDGYYTVTDVAYNRYGTVTETDGSYSVKATVERINVDGYGVERVKAPSYRVTVLTSGENSQEISVKVDLDGKDSATGEAVVPRLADSVSAYLVDAKETDWIASEFLTETLTIPSAGEDGYILLGTIQSLNGYSKELYEGTISNSEFMDIFNTVTLDDLEIVSSDLQGTSMTKNKITCNKFRLAYVASCGSFDLSFIKGFIVNKDITSVKLQNTSGYEEALVRVEKELVANGGKPLTAEQTIKAINNNN